MLIDEKICELVNQIEAFDLSNHENISGETRKLILSLRGNLENEGLIKRYKSYDLPGEKTLEPYPTDHEGYAVSFDPLLDEEGFWKTWRRYGMVVGKQVAKGELCDAAVARMREIVLDMSERKCDLEKPETWQYAPVDASGTPFISRGFFEVYHDAILAELRQSVRLYIHHVMIWGRTDLWSSFDRLGVKLPKHQESYALPLHVDQNPLIHPKFKTLQGVIALIDCPVERGTFVGVPSSKEYFSDYARFAPERGEYVELPIGDPLVQMLGTHAQAIPLRRGDIVSWDSRTTHANSENTSDQARYVAYVSAGPAREGEMDMVNARLDAFHSGIGSNVREALMHASKKSRYTDYALLQKVRKPEDLTVLGKLLYGQESYTKI